MIIDSRTAVCVVMTALTMLCGAANAKIYAARPTITPAPGTYESVQTVTLADTTAGAVIHYTTDGLDPNTNSAIYVRPLTIAESTLIKAIAVAIGYSQSGETSGEFIIEKRTAAPVLSPKPGSFGTAKKVTLSDATPGAAIYYTLDGSIPTVHSQRYSAPIKVNATTTIYAVAAAPKHGVSGVAGGGYTITSSQIAEVVLHYFSYATGDALGATAGLIQGSDGNFYGTTRMGGAHGAGAIFKITPSGAESVLYSFSGGVNSSTDGNQPGGALIELSDGNLYGVTTYGGVFNVGTVFTVTLGGVETVLHSFSGGWNGSGTGTSDGALSGGALVEGKDGLLYGTTQQGGAAASKSGTVYKISRSGAETVLHSFPASPNDGSGPLAGLLLASDGNFYGTTQDSASGAGTVFKVTPAGVESVLYAFTGNTSAARGSDGAQPAAGLIEGRDRNFYGTTLEGGTHNAGTAFKVTFDGVETVLHSFGGGTDGVSPEASLLLGSDGNFYGTAPNGGTVGTPDYYGVVFKMTASGVESLVHSFDYSDGDNPVSGLIQASDGSLYGTASGGVYGDGVVYKLVNVIPRSANQ